MFSMSIGKYKTEWEITLLHTPLGFSVIYLGDFYFQSNENKTEKNAFRSVHKFFTFYMAWKNKFFIVLLTYTEKHFVWVKWLWVIQNKH